MTFHSRLSSFHLPAAGTKIPALDGLRGLAILMVMLHHFGFYGRMRDGIFIDSQVRNILLSSWIGVDLFFVLSGFLITGILMESKRNKYYFRNFYMRRTLRIFPLYYSVLIILFILLPAIITPGPKYTSLLDSQQWYWTYLLNVYIGFYGWSDNFVIGHFWSLAVEEQFYMVWPLVVYLLGRRKLAATCGVLLLASLAARVALKAIGLETGAYVLTPARADALAVGGLAAIALRSEIGKAYLARWTIPTFWAAGSALVALFLWNGFLDTTALSVLGVGLSLLALFFGAGLILAVSAPESHVVNRLLCGRSLTFLGRYSYALYVFHHFVAVYLPKYLFRIDRFPRVFDSQLPGLILFSLVAGTISLVLALLSWHLLEARFLALKRAFQ